MQSSSRIGTELGEYRIDAVLGWGRNGVIYDAYDLHAARRVALDVLEPELAADPAFKRRFVREARKAAKLDHPNIVPLYAVGELDGQLYTAARYVDGDDLRALVRREGPLAPARALFILQQAAHALDAARAAGIPHRALDAEAILVERHSDHVYVCDFGLGRRGAPLVPALGALLEEMLTGQDVPLALDAGAGHGRRWRQRRVRERRRPRPGRPPRAAHSGGARRGVETGELAVSVAIVAAMSTSPFTPIGDYPVPAGPPVPRLRAGRRGCATGSGGGERGARA